MTRWLCAFASLWLVCLACLGASTAHADSSVVVLGVRSLDGEDALARDVSKALREGMRRVPSYRVSDRDVSLAQMSLVHGCDEPDARCMADIASTLEVDRLIYGTMVRVGPMVEIALFNFDAVTGQVESSLKEKLLGSDVQSTALGPLMIGLAKRLGGLEAVGSLHVLGNVPGASVFIDGVAAGILSDDGELVATSVMVGSHVVAIETTSGRAEQTVIVEDGTTAEVRLSMLQPEDEGELPSEDPEAPSAPMNWRRITGYSLVGVAGVFAVATGYTWFRIDAINGDSDLETYKNQYPMTVSDTCREADNRTLEKRDSATAELIALEGKARDLCDEASTLEVLQYVFLGTALVAGGTAAYLLLTDKAPDEDPSRLSLRPSWSPGRTRVDAILRF